MTDIIPVFSEPDYSTLEGGFDEINEDLINYHPIIDNDKIIKKVREYMENYNSEQYKQYKIELNNLYQKLGKRFYTIQKKNTVYLIKNVNKDDNIKIADSQEKNLKYVKKITHPLLLHIPTRQNELKDLIATKKNIVDNLFNEIKLDVVNRKENIKDFDKHKAEYTDLLEEKEIINLYYLIINKINTDNETVDVIYQEKQEDGNLEGKVYKINQNIITDINKIQGDRLEKYNIIMDELLSKYVDKPNELKEDTELMDNITTYLKNEDMKLINKETVQIRKKQDNYIDFIITKLPEY
jgi:hypothetical protein